MNEYVWSVEHIIYKEYTCKIVVGLTVIIKNCLILRNRDTTDISGLILLLQAFGQMASGICPSAFWPGKAQGE